jgi:hypothetical protein
MRSRPSRAPAARPGGEHPPGRRPRHLRQAPTAPWRQAIVFARAAGRAARAAKRAARQARAAARKTQLPGRNAMQSLPSGAPAAPPGGEVTVCPAGSPGGAPNPVPAPCSSRQQCSPLEREVAARLAGLRARGCDQRQDQPVQAPQTESAFPGRNAIQSLPSGAPAARPGGETAARPGGATAATARPPAPSPTARLAPAALHAPPPVRALQPTHRSGQTENPGRNALHRMPLGTCPGGERPVPPPLTRLTPTKAAALRSTTLAGTWNLDLAAHFAARFGPPLPAPGWRIPQAMPATDPISVVARSFLPAPQRPTPPATPEPATGRPRPPGHLSPAPDPARRPSR